MKISVVFVLLMSLFWASYFFYLYSEIKARFESRRWSVPARVFSAPVLLYPGQVLSVSQLGQIFQERRYQEAVREPLRAGEYKASRDRMTVYLREFKFPGHTLASRRIHFVFQQNRLARIQSGDADLVFLEIEPLEIARLFGPERESRSLINIEQVPRHLIDSVTAIEDHRFYEHRGVDWVGISRALWMDLRARRVVQGGSTITQQLVKNYFLEPERSVKRKLLEASMAVIIEYMYEKDEILEMYMNEIYLGQRGSVSIHGMGEAARYYFGRNVEDLSLAESATLAGMIRAPNAYSPYSSARASQDRRNTVLRRMLELGKIDSEEYERARLDPLRVLRTTPPVSAASYFVDYVKHQLHELYETEALESEGLNIYTTLHPEMAIAAELAVREGLEEIERTRSDKGGSGLDAALQVVLIAVHPKTGAVLALVGGRDYGESSFNRALYAHRQPGSAIKPFVYLSALDKFTPVSRIPDERTVHVVNGQPWSPRNYDDRYRGEVSLREAVEESVNCATVHVALDIGLDNVIRTLRNLGIQSPLEPLPSLALGAFEVTPIELAGAYAALGNDGQKPYLLSLKEVVAEKGEIIERRNIDMVSVTSPAKAFLVTSLLQGVVDRGTGKSIRRMGIDFHCAAKTGTTNDYRDSWFVGYMTDLLVLVWVGYDDNRSTHLTGAQGAARIWARFVNQVRPWINPQPFRIPPGVVHRIVCRESGALANTYCREKSLEFFLADNVIQEYCTIHGKN